jgi:hypothetical protein
MLKITLIGTASLMVMARAEAQSGGKVKNPGAIGQKVAEAAAKSGKKGTLGPDPMKAAAAASKSKDTTTKENGKDEGKTRYQVPVVRREGMSLSVGPAAIKQLAASFDDEDKARQLQASVESKRYDVMASLTAGVLKLLQADDGVDINAVFLPSDDPDAKKRMQTLNDQIGIALGVKRVLKASEATGKFDRVVYAEEVSKYFPQVGEDKDSEAYKRKNTLRTNFLHTLKKCAMAAAHMKDRKIKAEMDKKAGTLRLTGPAVKEQFGAPSVLLNEKKTQQDPKNAKNAIELKERPSFTAIAAKAAEAHGKVINRTSNTRGGAARAVQGLQPGNLEGSFVSIADTFIEALTKLPKKLTEKMAEKIEAVQSACEKTISEQAV